MSSDCHFCTPWGTRFVVYEDDAVLGVLDKEPINPYHALVIPKAHYTSFVELPVELASRIFLVAQRLSAALRAVCRPDAITHLSDDDVVGGGWNLVSHYKLHLIPRYAGDRVRIEWNRGPRSAEDRERDARQLRDTLRVDTGKEERAAPAPTPEVESFQRCIFASIDHLVDCLEGLSEMELNWRPAAAETNSLYAIAMHVFGNAEENILGTLCGQSVQRNREREFVVRGTSAAAVQERWRDLQARLRRGLATLASGELDRRRSHPRRGTMTGRDVLLIVARHAAEHWGEAQLTRSLLRSGR